MVLLTLLSIVQALALELLWGEVRQSAELYVMTLAALIGWLQVFVALTGIILIWLTYASIVMRFRWVPTTVDSIVPFLIGILEFVMVDSLDLAVLGRWFLLLATIFATMIVVSHATMRRARRDPDNAEFFQTVQPATLRDFYAPMITVGGFLVASLFFWIRDERGWVAATALVIALAVLLNQLLSSAHDWRRSMQPGPADE